MGCAQWMEPGSHGNQLNKEPGVMQDYIDELVQPLHNNKSANFTAFKTIQLQGPRQNQWQW